MDSKLVDRSPGAVGTDTPARHVVEGDIVLVESRVVRGFPTGSGCETVALVIFVKIVDGGSRRVLYWIGAAPGHDAEHVTTGASLYEAGSPVTVLSRIGLVAA
jgi:hypothetical protein